jgi:hypothetical protein
MTNSQKGLHLSAAVCFVIAILLYILGANFFLGLLFFGFVFEVIAWVLLLTDK